MVDDWLKDFFGMTKEASTRMVSLPPFLPSSSCNLLTPADLAGRRSFRLRLNLPSPRRASCFRAPLPFRGFPQRDSDKEVGELRREIEKLLAELSAEERKRKKAEEEAASLRAKADDNAKLRAEVNGLKHDLARALADLEAERRAREAVRLEGRRQRHAGDTSGTGRDRLARPGRHGGRAVRLGGLLIEYVGC